MQRKYLFVLLMISSITLTLFGCNTIETHEEIETSKQTIIESTNNNDKVEKKDSLETSKSVEKDDHNTSSTKIINQSGNQTKLVTKENVDYSLEEMNSVISKIIIEYDDKKIVAKNNEKINFVGTVSFNIYFNNQFDLNQLQDKTRFEPGFRNVGTIKNKIYEDGDFLDKAQIWGSIYPSDSIPKDFKLVLDKGLTDLSGNQLEDDVTIYFHRIKTTSVDIKLITNDKKYDEFYLLNNNPKTFEFTFSDSVTKKSVEDELQKQFLNGENLFFDWKDDQHLRLEGTNLQNGEHQISLSNAKDKNNININYWTSDSLVFDIEPNDKIYTMDLENLELEPININYSNDFIWKVGYLIPKGEHIVFNEIYGIDSIIGPYNRPVLYNLSSEKSMYIDSKVDSTSSSKNNKIFLYKSYIYDMEDHLIGKIDIREDEKVIGKKVSPNQKIIAVLLGRDNDDYRFHYDNRLDLKIYNNRGNLLKTIPINLKHTYVVGSGLYTISLRVIWLDNQTIVIEALAKDAHDFEGVYNIYKIKIENNQVDLIYKEAYDPLLINSNQLLIVDNDGDFKLIDTKGNIVQDIPLHKNITDWPLYKKSNLEIYSVNNNIIFKDSNELNIYDIKNNKLNKIETELRLLGVFDGKLLLSHSKINF